MAGSGSFGFGFALLDKARDGERWPFDQFVQLAHHRGPVGEIETIEGLHPVNERSGVYVG